MNSSRSNSRAADQEIKLVATITMAAIIAMTTSGCATISRAPRKLTEVEKAQAVEEIAGKNMLKIVGKSVKAACLKDEKPRKDWVYKKGDFDCRPYWKARQWFLATKEATKQARLAEPYPASPGLVDNSSGFNLGTFLMMRMLMQPPVAQQPQAVFFYGGR